MGDRASRPHAITTRGKSFCERTTTRLIDDRARGDRTAVEQRWAGIQQESCRQYVAFLLAMLIDAAPNGAPAEHLIRGRYDTTNGDASWLVLRADIGELIIAHRRLRDLAFGSPSPWQSAWSRVRDSPGLAWMLADLAVAAWLR